MWKALGLIPSTIKQNKNPMILISLVDDLGKVKMVFSMTLYKQDMYLSFYKDFGYGSFWGPEVK
jgi:hypothetical protein